MTRKCCWHTPLRGAPEKTRQSDAAQASGRPWRPANRPDVSRFPRSPAPTQGKPGSRARPPGGGHPPPRWPGPAARPAPPRGCYPDKPRQAGPGPLTSRAPEPEGANGRPTPQRHVRRRLLTASSPRVTCQPRPARPGGGGHPAEAVPESVELPPSVGGLEPAFGRAAAPALLGRCGGDSMSAY